MGSDSGSHCFGVQEQKVGQRIVYEEEEANPTLDRPGWCGNISGWDNTPLGQVIKAHFLQTTPP